MNPLLDKLLFNLNQFLKANGRELVDVSAVWFALDTDVRYGQVNILSKKKLLDVDRFSSLITPMVEGGPSWVHGNLAYTQDQRPVVCLAFGALIGNSSPALNVSCEDKPLVISD